MRPLMRVAAVLAAAGMLAAQAPPARRAGTAGPTLKLSARIVHVRLARGEGMPYLEVEAGGKNTRVYLGSMRYLVENDFNPKAGEQVEIEGYRRGNAILATRVRLVAEDKTLRLRDKNGRPLWQRGWGRRRRGRNRSGRAGNNP